MSCLVVVGTQWGDEGKGKVVDLLTEKSEIVVRYQGGNNAGHTVMFEDQTFILHLIPSGILREATSILGNGVVIDLGEIVKEIEQLEELGIEVAGKLKISQSCHLIMPYHKALDQMREQRRERQKIGTTGRGIGPAYQDKVGRFGIRIGDLANPTYFRQRLAEVLPEKNCLFSHYFQSKPFTIDEILEEYLEHFEKIKHYVADISSYLNEALVAKKNILFEGAQGTFLDIDHGTYPYVTSSNTTSGCASTGSGIGPQHLKKVLGIVKAYTTRVGEGPFPSELHDEVGKRLQTEGKEFGATTGRPRRCGWFDAVLVQQAVNLNGITSLALMKLDVLDHFENIKIATAYRNKEGKTITQFCSGWNLADWTPIYEEMEGWQSSTYGITDYDRLPEKAQAYLQRIEDLLGIPISLLSTGPRREETILRRPDLLLS